jgi:hypothetical protein
MVLTRRSRFPCRPAHVEHAANRRFDRQRNRVKVRKLHLSEIGAVLLERPEALAVGREAQ